MLEGWNDGIMVGNKFFLQLNGMKTQYSIIPIFQSWSEVELKLIWR
jgi:hypothetical protein